MRDINNTSEDNNKMSYNEFLNKYNTMKNKRTTKDSVDNSDILYGVKSNNSSSSSLNSSCSSNASNKVPYTSYQDYLKKYETKKFAPVKLNENTLPETKITQNGSKPKEIACKPKICVKSELVVQISSNGNCQQKQVLTQNVQKNVQNHNKIAAKLNENLNNRSFNNEQMSANNFVPINRSNSSLPVEKKIVVNQLSAPHMVSKEQSAGITQLTAPPPPPPPMPTANTLTRTPPLPPKLPPSNLPPSYATLTRSSSTNSTKSRGLTPKDLLLDELMSKTKRYDPPETNSNQLQRTSSSPIASPKLINTSPRQLPNICTLPRPTTVKSMNKSKFPLPSPTFNRKFSNQIKPNQNQNVINKISNEEANTTTVITVNDNVDSVVRSDPNVKKYVYNTYRGLLGAYNNKANEFISNTTGIIVKEDKGVSRQLESLA